MRTRDENKVEAISTKAIEIIVEKGFDGLSMQKLAKAANVSPATIYIYFKDREDLILQLAMDAVQKMTEATFAGFKPTMSFAEGLKIQWKNRAKFWLENPLQARFMEYIRHSHISEAAFRKIRKDFSEGMKEFVHGAIKRKELIALPLEVYWSVAFAPLYQLIKFHNDGTSLAGEKFAWSDNYMNKTLKLVIKALEP